MDSSELVKRFLTYYEKSDYTGMQACLADDTKFSDYAFESISGAEVKAMWHWFCIP